MQAHQIPRRFAPRDDSYSSDGAPLLLRRRPACPRHLIRFDLSGIESLRAGEHLVDRLVEIGGRFALESQRIHARDDERLEVGTLHAARLEGLHGFVHRLVQRQQLLGALATRRQCVRQLR